MGPQPPLSLIDIYFRLLWENGISDLRSSMQVSKCIALKTLFSFIVISDINIL